MTIYPVVRWGGLDCCLTYDCEKGRLSFRKFRALCPKGVMPEGYYGLFLNGVKWVFIREGGKWYFIGGSGKKVWMGDRRLSFRKESGPVFSQFVAAYGKDWELRGYAFSAIDMSRIDPTRDELDEMAEDIVKWAKVFQDREKSHPA